MVYKKRTWTNARIRHTRETNGSPSLAVDGIEKSLDWSKCATIDNYFVEKPVWMVDLGRKTNIAGVMLRTWSENKGNLNK